ncbi:MAG TPA: FMN-binding protein [Candidatus Nanoarchaeia archaeon]|nr:FMN-binding protein [Candidatus Nanoarchaeia archaeon]
MNKEMSVVLIKLVALSIVAAAILGAVYIPTQDQLKIYQEDQKKLALVDVMPLADHFDPVIKSGDEILYYRALDADNNLVGYSFFRDQSGSQSVITLAGGIDTNYKVTGVKIMTHAETPGLGAKIIDLAFTDQFKGVSESDLMLSKKGGAIDAITGASISSQAVIDGIQTKINEIKSNE